MFPAVGHYTKRCILGFDSSLLRNQKLNIFKNKVVYESSIPLSIASIVFNVGSEDDLRAVFDRLVKEKACNKKILSKIAELGKDCGLTYVSPPGIIDKLKLRYEKFFRV